MLEKILLKECTPAHSLDSLVHNFVFVSDNVPDTDCIDILLI